MKFGILLLSCMVTLVPMLGVWADSSNVELVACYSLSGSGTAEAVHVVGNYAYVADGTEGLKVIDISDPANAWEVGSCDTPGYASDVYVYGNYAYVADYNAGLCVIDASDPTNPNVERSISDARNAEGVHVVYVDGKYVAYVAGWAYDPQYHVDCFTFWEITSANPDFSLPRTVSKHTFLKFIGYYVDSYANGVYVDGSYAYVAGNEGIRIFDTESKEWTSCSSPGGGARGVHVAENYAYLADGACLSVIDVSDPTNPEMAGFYDTDGYAEGVYVAGNHAYVAAGYAGLRVIDVSDPASLHEVGFYDTDGYAGGIYVDGSYAYLADGVVGLCILRYTGVPDRGSINGHVTDRDTGDPIRWALVIARKDPVREIALTDVTGFYEIMDLEPGEYLLLAYKKGYKLGFARVTVLPGDCVTWDFKLKLKAAEDDEDEIPDLANFPNPFNPDTWIPYLVTEDADVTIRIHDASGKLIRILNLGHKAAGFYGTKEKAAYWDGRNEAGEEVASGIYFYTIQAGDFTATKKMIVRR